MSDITEIKKQELIEQLCHYIKDIKFGSLTIVINDEKIVQIEKNIKFRPR